MRKILLLDKNKNYVKRFNINDIPLNKSIIKEKCKEYFGDDDPCIIHINYISKKMLLEIQEIVDEKETNTDYEINNILVLHKYIENSKDYRFVKVVED